MSNITLSHVRGAIIDADRRSKIVCTLGPACWSVEGLLALIDAGMNVARFNFSHGDHAGHFACLERLRSALSMRPGIHVAVMLDTKGPEIRTGFLDKSLNGKLSLAKGQLIEIGTDYDKPCTSAYLACSYKSLPTSVSVGSKILAADGALSLRVTELRVSSVVAEVLNNATFGDRKNMNLPGAIVDLPTLTEKDIDDLQNWGVKHNVDFVAASFVRKPSDLDFIRSVLGEAGQHIKIISKIENQEGLENFDGILSKTDGIMVARGDLGMEIPLEKVFLAQKMMIYKSNIAGKPVVTATQMLESMIGAPRPTRAEAGDVANAILDGSDAVMLSGETANGEYSVEAVSMMRNACIAAESMLDYEAVFAGICGGIKGNNLSVSLPESVAASAVRSAREINAAAIIVLSEDGDAARLVAKYRPSVPVFVVTNSASSARQARGYMRNCDSYLIDGSPTVAAAVAEAMLALLARELVRSGQLVVTVSGSETESAFSAIDMMRVHTVQ